MVRRRPRRPEKEKIPNDPVIKARKKIRKLKLELERYKLAFDIQETEYRKLIMTMRRVIQESVLEREGFRQFVIRVFKANYHPEKSDEFLLGEKDEQGVPDDEHDGDFGDSTEKRETNNLSGDGGETGTEG